MTRLAATAAILLTGAAVLLFQLVGCGRERAAAGEGGDRLLVVASIAPLADFVREVGGEHAEVEMLVAPGTSPHTFEPTPRQLELLSRAALLVLNGIGLEFWADDLVSAAQNPKLRAVRTADGLDIIRAGRGQGHQDVGNPHVWLDPICAIHQVEQIRDALIEVDPAEADVYHRNAEAYVGELRTLDAEIRGAVGTLSRREFVGQHAVWSYFARRYGLVEAGVIESTPGDEASPRELSELVGMMHDQNVTAIFVEPQLSQKAARIIAAETGAAIVELDPLGRPPDRGYLETMRANLRKMAHGLGQGEGP
jgi:ABC-type Zn uptake system ZnuABC Zn-binding protein ZnuA